MESTDARATSILAKATAMRRATDRTVRRRRAAIDAPAYSRAGIKLAKREAPVGHWPENEETGFPMLDRKP